MEVPRPRVELAPQAARPEGGKQMPNIEIRFKVTLELNEKWARNQTTEELVDYLKARLNSSLGFRGQIKKLNLVAR
jgi:hypothetical protein